MALEFAATQEAIDTIGIREDLTDLIYMISPTETPFQMMCSRGTASERKHEWQMDRLSAHADNAFGEGHVIVNGDLEHIASTRLANHTQISVKAISQTGTLEVVNKAGRSSELSYQLAKKAKELKRDMEFGCVGQTTVANMASVAAADGGGIRRSAAVQAMSNDAFYQSGAALDGTHVNRGGGAGAEGGWDNTSGLFDAPTDGTQRALLESMLKGVIQGAWTNGGDPSVVHCGPFNKTVISEMTGSSTRFDRGEDKRLVAAIDVYVSDFGEHTIIPNRFQRDRDLFCFTPELWKICFLRPFRQFALAKTGDTEVRELLVEWTLQGGNQSGNGFIHDLLTS